MPDCPECRRPIPTGSATCSHCQGTHASDPTQPSYRRRRANKTGALEPRPPWVSPELVLIAYRAASDAWAIGGAVATVVSLVCTHLAPGWWLGVGIGPVYCAAGVAARRRVSRYRWLVVTAAVGQVAAGLGLVAAGIIRAPYPTVQVAGVWIAAAGALVAACPPPDDALWHRHRRRRRIRFR